MVIIRVDDHPADLFSGVFTNPLVPVVPQKNGNVAWVVNDSFIIDADSARR